ncbi:membrane protein [Corynebacterium phocae]|uniref:Membrane protein n=1 Tax=Corynebacterium phocae TaxID=161895 RepID=A0A1L7D481_9CORY|nr:GtrA family protein [Corynebacterium phocae]APT92821.1 membrane protein [Corynebacterium phocae]KAA8723138.1 GtrA family protein [Corynebacterium phocae]
MSRLSTNMGQFVKFGLVGGSGTLVNLAVAVLCKKLAWWTAQISEQDPVLNLFGTAFHIRWYHVFVTIAFVVANIWNYQLNRMWTFRSVNKVSWLRGFLPFLLTGIGALMVSLITMTLLMNPESPVGLPSDIFDNSTGLRTKFYWANAVSIVVAMPLNFVINKLWAFRTSPATPASPTSPATPDTQPGVPE